MGQEVDNAGTIDLQSGNLQLHDSGYFGLLVNLPGGVVDLAADVSVGQYGYNGMGFNNEGLLLKSGGTNTSTISINPFNTSGGSISVDSGALALSGNNFAQGGGTFSVNLGGTNTGSAGEMTGVGSASLGGLLTVNLTNGFVPAVGSRFQILSAASSSGVFSPLNVPAGISVSYSNSGVYLTVTSAVALAPAITVQPTNATVPYAGGAGFSVAATGLEPLGYQWLQGGVPMTDGGVVSGSATPNLALDSVTDNNAGKYSVIITNAYGSVTSVVATLTVLNCTAPPAGLVSWWPGDGNALDIVGGNNGVLEGGVTFTNGEVGQAFSLDGSTGWVAVTNSSALNPTGPFSVECWIQANSSQNYGNFLIVDHSHGFTDGTGWVLQGLTADGTVAFGYGIGGSTGDAANFSTVSTTNSVLDNRWHHLAGVWTGTQLQIYLDGALQSAMTQTAPPVNNSRAVEIGAAWGGGATTRYFHGSIDEVSYYDTALTAGQISGIYGAGAAGKCLSQAPDITGQPQSQSVVLGGTATFTVAATGLLPLTNQWRLNGTNLTDNGRITGSQSNILVITNVQFADAGTYLVSVTNVAGGVVSQPATLGGFAQDPGRHLVQCGSHRLWRRADGDQLNATSNVPGMASLLMSRPALSVRTTSAIGAASSR